MSDGTMTVEKSSPFYVTGGTLPVTAACYVERAADRELFEALLRGDYCYVLNTRQMGKSSLMVRTAARLTSITCVSLSATSLPCSSGTRIVCRYPGVILRTATVG